MDGQVCNIEIIQELFFVNFGDFPVALYKIQGHLRDTFVSGTVYEIPGLSPVITNVCSPYSNVTKNNRHGSERNIFDIPHFSTLFIRK